jgi:lipopolysaccharide export system permease protein
MDEINTYAERVGSMPLAFLQFYGPYAFLLFELTGAIVSLLALLFSVGLLRRTGELTALLSAGISHGRIMRPMLMAALVLTILAALNREFVLPRWQDQLSLRAQDLVTSKEKPLLPVYDRLAGVLIKGKGLLMLEQEIVSPAFKLHNRLPQVGSQLVAERARWVAATEQHPAGFVLVGVTQPKNIDSIASQQVSEHAFVRTSFDTPWLQPQECFVASRVEFDFLQPGTAWMRMAKTSDLVRRVSNPAVYCSSDVRVTLHDRWLRPFLDFSLVVLSLSLVVGRKNRNMFVVTGYATLLVAFFFGMRTLFHTLGGNDYLIDPATAAWIPLLVLAPIAFARYQVLQVS